MPETNPKTVATSEPTSAVNDDLNLGIEGETVADWLSPFVPGNSLERANAIVKGWEGLSFN